MKIKERVRKLGELGMLNRGTPKESLPEGQAYGAGRLPTGQVGESGNRRLFSVHRFTVSPFPHFLSVVAICVLLSLFTVHCSLFTPAAEAAGLEVSMAPPGAGDFGFMDYGETTTTAGDNRTISGSLDGIEDIDIRVSSTGIWSADDAGGNGVNKFGLREHSESGKIIKATDVNLITDLGPQPETYDFVLWFKAPAEGSEEGPHILTVILTAKNWEEPPSPEPQWCIDAGGYWAATQLPAPDDYGCWFYSGQTEESCSTTCAKHGLICAAKDWNDDNSCSACKHLTGTSGCETGGIQNFWPAYYDSHSNCYTRSTTYTQDCSIPNTWSRRICVCEPAPVPEEPQWCTDASGYWAPKNDGTGDYGCWFQAVAANTSCITECAAKGLACSPTNWNDDTSCSVCHQLSPEKVDCGCNAESSRPVYGHENSACRYRCTGTNQACDALPGSNAKRLCVCEPPPWGEVACEAIEVPSPWPPLHKGQRKWLPLIGGTSGSGEKGCWCSGGTMVAAGGNELKSCTEVCTSLQAGLQCKRGGWNDDTSCTITKAFGGGGGACTASGSYPPTKRNNCGGPQGHYYYSGSIGTDLCDIAFPTSYSDMGCGACMCVCEPIPPPLASCKEIYDAGQSTGDDVYTIDPDGAGGDAPFEVYCDMTTDGGGWTLAAFRGLEVTSRETFIHHGTVRTDFGETKTTDTWSLRLDNNKIENGIAYTEMAITRGAVTSRIVDNSDKIFFKWSGTYKISANWNTERESGSYLFSCYSPQEYVSHDGWDWGGYDLGFYAWKGCCGGHCGILSLGGGAQHANVSGVGSEYCYTNVHGCGAAPRTYAYFWVR